MKLLLSFVYMSLSYGLYANFFGIVLRVEWTKVDRIWEITG